MTVCLSQSAQGPQRRIRLLRIGEVPILNKAPGLRPINIWKFTKPFCLPASLPVPANLRPTNKKFFLCTTHVRFLEILLRFFAQFFNSFRSFGFWLFEFVSDFGFRASDLVAALPRCVLSGSAVKILFGQVGLPVVILQQVLTPIVS